MRQRTQHLCYDVLNATTAAGPRRDGAQAMLTLIRHHDALAHWVANREAHAHSLALTSVHIASVARRRAAAALAEAEAKAAPDIGTAAVAADRWLCGLRHH